MFRRSIKLTFFQAVLITISMMVLTLLSTRLFLSIRRQVKMRETAQVARKCLKEVENQAEELRNLRRDVTFEKESFLSQMTMWEREKRDFISTRLNALLKEIRAESDRTAVLDQCLKFIELITSSSAPGHEGTCPNPGPDLQSKSEAHC